MTKLSPKEPLFPKEPLRDSSKFKRRFVFTSSAREAWEAFLLAYSQQRSAHVLLPAYIGYTDREGSGVFDPVSRSGLGFGFYPVNDFLYASSDVLEALLRTRKYGVLLVVHWFGLPHVDMSKVRALCQLYDVFLVEDCAHVMAPPHVTSTDLGSWGDAAFYSVHKMYGGDVGGMLSVRPDSAFDAAILPSVPPAKGCPADLLESMLSVDVAGVISHRRGLYQTYADAFESTDGIMPLFPDMGPYTPQTFAVAVSSELREPLYFALMDRGIPLTALYYRLISQIDEESFPTSIQLANSILNFPVHQDVNEEQVAVIIACTIEVLQQLRP